MMSLTLPLWGTGTAQAQKNAKPVMIMTIDGEIEHGVAAYVKRVLEQAELEGAAAVVMEVDTPGGRLDSALKMKDDLLDAQVPVYAFINRQAFSAGALISLAANEIYMVKGAVMGAATPVTGQSGEKASEKMVSAVRKAFASTAEARNRRADIAEAMVDESVAIEGLVEKDKLLSLTAEEAMKWDYAEAIVANLDELLARHDLQNAPRQRVEPALAEQLVRFLTNPVVSSLLMSLGFLGLLLELKTAGWGVGGTLGLVALGLFFWSHHLAGLAGWEGMVLVAVGIVLMALEIFVIPGFGVAGGLGIVSFLAGLYLSLVGDFSYASAEDFLGAAYKLLAAVAIMIVGTVMLVRYLPGSRLFEGGLVLSANLERESDEAEADVATQPVPHVHPGDTGKAMTDLRPSGTAVIKGRRWPVVTQGEYLEAGTQVSVVEAHGNRVVVQAVETDTGTG
jgi:membrane-bound serine protease (ClpP class)